MIHPTPLLCSTVLLGSAVTFVVAAATALSGGAS